MKMQMDDFQCEFLVALAATSRKAYEILRNKFVRIFHFAWKWLVIRLRRLPAVEIQCK